MNRAWLFFLLVLALVAAGCTEGLAATRSDTVFGGTRVEAISTYRYTSTNVATSSVTIAAANVQRRGFVIYNNSSNTTYVSFACPAVGSAPVRPIATFASWEVYGPVVWTGQLCAIRNSGSGVVSVWELQ
jgi:hypothetical protein